MGHEVAERVVLMFCANLLRLLKYPLTYQVPGERDSGIFTVVKEREGETQENIWPSGPQIDTINQVLRYI